MAALAWALVTFPTGCETCQTYTLTGRLWSNDDMNRFHEPAPDPALALYDAPRHGDVLVVYTEVNERSTSVRRRAYFLNANSGRIEANRKPHFVSFKEAGGLREIPLKQPGPGTPAAVAPSPLYAAAATNGHLFTVFRNGVPQGPSELPVYRGRADVAWRAVLTPAAVVGDVVLIGAITGLATAPLWGPSLSGQSL